MTDKKESVRQILIEALQRIADEHGVMIRRAEADWATFIRDDSTGGKVIALEIEAII